MATLKPTTPLLAPNKGTLKPASPLRPKIAPKTPISHPQRRRRFQTRLSRHEQRCWRFQESGPPPTSTPGATGVKGTGGICRGAGGRWRGLAGLRDDAPSEARGADGERAGRPRGGRRSVGATSTPHTPRRHNKTARPQWGRAAVAVALGFEPRVAVTPHSISSAAPSAARTRYLTRILYYTLPPRAQIDRAGWEQGHTAAWEHGHTATRSHAAHAAHAASETGATSAFRSIENEIK